MGWGDLFGEVRDILLARRPGEWEEGEVGARLGEAVLHQIVKRKDRPLVLREESMPGEAYWDFDPFAETDYPGAGPYRIPGSPGYGGGEVYGPQLPAASGGYRRRRRMNPMNARAAARAIRRVVAVRKILHRIERHLPRVRVKPKSPFRKR